MIIHKFDQFYLVLGLVNSANRFMDILENASLVGTNSVWGSVVSAKRLSPESVSKFAKTERSLSIFINSIVLYSLVLSTPLGWVHLPGQTLELK
jgi:hypothetical protein